MFCVLIGLAHFIEFKIFNLPKLDFISLDLHLFEQPVPLHSCTSLLCIFNVSVYLCLPTVPVYHLCLLQLPDVPVQWVVYEFLFIAAVDWFSLCLHAIRISIQRNLRDHTDLRYRSWLKICVLTDSHIYEGWTD